MKRLPLAILILLSIGIPLFVHAGNYRLGPDNTLRITVYREKELGRTVRISSDGYISFPLLGKLKAKGLTVPELEHTLAEGLKRYIVNPQVTIFIIEYSTITITGQVKKPGSYTLKGSPTIIEAIGRAGGFTKMAGRNDVRVMRTEDGKEKTIRVRVAEISKRGDRSRDIALKPDDVIFVPESLF